MLLGLGRTLRIDRSRLRYAVYRWLIPRLGGIEPLACMNLAEKAWPIACAKTTLRRYQDRLDEVDWGSFKEPDGAELLKQRARDSDPIVLRRYFRGAHAWSLERIRNELGEVTLPVRVGDYASMGGDPEVFQMRVADFIDYLSGVADFPAPDRLVEGLGAYLANVSLPTIASQLPQPKYFFPKAPVTTFWLGLDSFTPLHCHQFCDVLLVQIAGHRRVRLVPPHQAPLIGCVPRNVNMCTATFNPFDSQGSSATEVIERPVCDLEPGDALLIPGFWFHAVRFAGVSFSGSQFNESGMPLSIGGGPREAWTQRPYQRGWG